MDTFKSICVFAKIVEYGSLTAAAVDMDISTAMVSKHLKHLESYFGARLFQRTTRSLKLTEEGRLYYEHCHATLTKMDELRATVGNAKRPPSGTLRIAVPPLAEIAHLRTVIPTYVSNFPQVTLDVVYADGVPNLIEDSFDLALHVAESLPNSSMISRRLAPVKYVVCASPDYLLAAGRPAVPQDLNHHLVLTHSSWGDACVFRRHGDQQAIKLDRHMFLHSHVLAKRLVEDGLGIAILPAEAVAAHIAEKRLEVLFADYQLPERYLYVIYPSRKHLPAKVRAFIDVLAAEFNRGDAEVQSEPSARDPSEPTMAGQPLTVIGKDAGSTAPIGKSGAVGGRSAWLSERDTASVWLDRLKVTAE